MPFDAVIVIAFGGPQGPADVRPFLSNVLRGRRVAPERIDEVAHHYDRFNGVSPLTALTLRQADGLARRLHGLGRPLPVYVGMRNWHPYLEDTLAAMSRAGIRRAIALVAAAHRSYSGCTQYRENVDAARAALRSNGLEDVEVVYVGDWHLHTGFIDANAEHVHRALQELPAGVRDRARLIFTAHSIPVPMAERFPYRQQLEESARAIVAALQARDTALDWALVYQSRSGRPDDPWLGPDICDALREAHANGLAAAVVCPVGFICDHIEVLYDLDVEAAAVCHEIGLPIARALAVNDHPRFLDAMADAVMQVMDRYAAGRPLRIVPPMSRGAG